MKTIQFGSFPSLGYGQSMPASETVPFLHLLRSQRSYDFFGHWLARRRGPSLPLRSDIDPVDLKPWMGNVTLIETRRPQAGYHIRVWPTRVAEFSGADFHNRPLDAVRPRNLAEKLSAWCDEAVSEGQPVAGHCSLSGTLSDAVFEVVVMPLSRNGETADMVLGGLFPLEFVT